MVSKSEDKMSSLDGAPSPTLYKFFVSCIYSTVTEGRLHRIYHVYPCVVNRLQEKYITIIGRVKWHAETHLVPNPFMDTTFQPFDDPITCPLDSMRDFFDYLFLLCFKFAGKSIPILIRGRVGVLEISLRHLSIRTTPLSSDTGRLAHADLQTE